MSTDRGVSPEGVEGPRLLVGEIARLARTSLEPAVFCAEFLSRMVSAMAAVGGAVWTVEDGGGLALQRQINLQQTKIGEKDEEDQGRHSRLLQKAFSEANGLLVPPHSTADNGRQGGNSTDYRWCWHRCF